MLEEGSFRGRTADFVFMFLFGGLLMTVSFVTVQNQFILFLCFVLDSRFVLDTKAQPIIKGYGMMLFIKQSSHWEQI